MNSEVLTQKLGPLPVWTWGTIAGAGVLALVYWQQMTAGSTPAGDSAPAYVPADSGALDGAFYSAKNGSGATPPATLAETNSSWLATAGAVLSGKGLAPLDIQNALTRYLNGEPLSDTDRGIVNQALTAKGAPPDGASTPGLVEYARYYRDASAKVFGVAYNGAVHELSGAEYAALGRPSLSVDDYKPVTAPAPVATPAPATAPVAAPAPAARTYTVRRGDTLSGIASRYGISWRAIFDANRDKISNANLIYPGQVLRIP